MGRCFADRNEYLNFERFKAREEADGNRLISGLEAITARGPGFLLASRYLKVFKSFVRRCLKVD